MIVECLKCKTRVDTKIKTNPKCEISLKTNKKKEK